MPDEPTDRAARCCACGRPVWPVAAATDRGEPPPPPELCDYCAAARH